MATEFPIPITGEPVAEWTAADVRRLALIDLDSLGATVVTPEILTFGMAVPTPTVAMGDRITPTILTIATAVITPSVVFGTTTIRPTILTINLATPASVVAAGAVPLIRLARVKARFEFRVVDVQDGLGG